MASEVAGKAGSVRVASLKMSCLKAMQRHERREDALGQARRVRDVDPLVYDASGEKLELVASYERHVAGARRNKGADAVALHAFVQFPTDLIKITDANEKKLLQAAVIFINKTHGGNAVFHARLDRDEAGRHGVDVFFAPKYEKKSKSKPDGEKWVSLTKFGKSLALSKYGQNSPAFQGRALQDAFFEFLSNDLRMRDVKRGNKKVTRDKDRIDPEVYKINKEKEKLEIANLKLNDKISKFNKEKLDFVEYKNNVLSDLSKKKELNKKNSAIGFALEKYFEGKIYVNHRENTSENSSRYYLSFDPELISDEQKHIYQILKPFIESVKTALFFFEDMFKEMRLTKDQERKMKYQHLSRVRANLRDSGIDL